MKKKVTLSTTPVAWHNGEPTKYQSVLTYPVSEERHISLLSSPMPTEQAALDDLHKELILWMEAISAFNKEINS